MTFDSMAKELGVSKSTISRALSGKGRISTKTRSKVLQLVEENKDDVRRDDSVKKIQTGNIGVVIPTDVYSAGIPYFQDCLLGICEAASMLDYNVLITTSVMNDISEIKKLVEQDKVDGIIMTRSLDDDKALQYLTQIHFPVGLTGRCQYDDVIQVDANNQMAAESLTSMLIGRGYHKFALLVEHLDYHVNRSRYDGFMNAIQKHMLNEEQQYIKTEALKYDFLDNVINDIMAKKIECIICGDDVVATRIVSKLQSEGYRIPMDISVASLYNSPNLNCFTPAITAVNISAKQIGNIIGKQMINYLNGKEYDSMTITDFELLFRKSADRSRNKGV